MKRILIFVLLIVSMVACENKGSEKLEIKDYSDVYNTQDLSQWLNENNIEAENTSDTEYVVTKGEKIGSRIVSLKFSNNDGLGITYSREYTGSIEKDKQFVMDFYNCLVKQYGYGQAMNEEMKFTVDAGSDWDEFYEGLLDIMNQWDVNFSYDEETGYMYQNLEIIWYKEHMILRINVSPDNDWVQIKLSNMSPQIWEKMLRVE